jgi:predicted alpha/beta-fold hydrolase
MQTLVTRRLLFRIAIIVSACFFCTTTTIFPAEKRQPTVKDHVKVRIKAENINAALGVVNELVEYYVNKFRPVSTRVYYEKSDGDYILHVFTDFKNMDDYKQISSKARSDPEWVAMFEQALSAVNIQGDMQLHLYTSITAFSQPDPVSDLSQGQEGKIYFSSVNLGSFKEILAGEGQSKPVTISGTLKLPKEVNGKVPAVIILHGAGGINDYYFEVADMLNEMRIAAFVVDSFGPRGIQSGEIILKKLFHSYATRISDAYAALELLSTHPKIDKRFAGHL